MSRKVISDLETGEVQRVVQEDEYCAVYKKDGSDKKRKKDGVPFRFVKMSDELINTMCLIHDIKYCGYVLMLAKFVSYDGYLKKKNGDMMKLKDIASEFGLARQTTAKIIKSLESVDIMTHDGKRDMVYMMNPLMCIRGRATNETLSEYKRLKELIGDVNDSGTEKTACVKSGC